MAVPVDGRFAFVLAQASSCSQIRSTRQPWRRSIRVTRRSRARFAANFFRQKAALPLGFVPCCGHPCQKQPSTNRASRSFGNGLRQPVAKGRKRPRFQRRLRVHPSCCRPLRKRDPEPELESIASCVDPFAELGSGDAQRLGDADHILDARIPLPALNVADVSPIQLCAFRELLLREFSVLPAQGNTLTKGFQGGVFTRHPLVYAALSAMSLSTMSDNW